MIGTVGAEQSSIEQGEKLFNDNSLGGSTNDTSCATCHPNGKDLEKAGEKQNLTETINRCITGPLKGNKIDGRTVEMRSLKMYIQSLSKK
ncbi:MAG: cytochrome-c peroxidase [Proteobacteria bacterium]|nr:cytochrome-c peroxidase [Pseudomonadota bacterium]MBU1714304.1 cytochrome-c peroxidase [Pseudomonadota bacterium]